MVYGDQRLLPDESEGLCSGYADYQRHDQAGLIGDGNCVDIAFLQTRLADGGGYHRQDLFDMGTGGYFRHDAAEFGMQLDLGGDNGGFYVPAVGDNSGGGFVATGLNAQYVYLFVQCDSSFPYEKQ